MEIKVIKTRKFMPPKDDLLTFLKKSIKELKENSIVAISSKIVSIGEGRCIHINKVKSKDVLIKKEADYYLPRSYSPYNKMHTITKDTFVANAGIDESNGNGYYILWPTDPKKSARRIWDFLRKEYSVKNLGVVITDSRAMPLRRGIVGMSLSFWGFLPLKDYRGKRDIFGRVFKASQLNIPDNLASAAVLVMGEGAEQTPIVVFQDITGIEFSDKAYASNKPYSSYEVSMNEDLFSPFLKTVAWKKGGFPRK